MSLEKYTKVPVSYFNFSHLYDKLKQNAGTTIRFSLTDDKKYHRKQGDLVRMAHSRRILFVAEITRIEKKRIIDIPLKLLQEDVSPFKISRHSDFVKLLQTFYAFPITLDSKIYVIWWRRIE